MSGFLKNPFSGLTITVFKILACSDIDKLKNLRRTILMQQFFFCFHLLAVRRQDLKTFSFYDRLVLRILL